MFVFMVLLLIITVVQSCVYHTSDGGHGRKKNDADKDHSGGPDDGIQINQNWIWKKIDKAEEDDDDKIIAILTDHQGLKTRLKDNKVF